LSEWLSKMADLECRIFINLQLSQQKRSLQKISSSRPHKRHIFHLPNFISSQKDYQQKTNKKKNLPTPP